MLHALKFARPWHGGLLWKNLVLVGGREGVGREGKGRRSGEERGRRGGGEGGSGGGRKNGRDRERDAKAFHSL